MIQPVTTGSQNFGLVVVTGYRCLPEFRTQSGYRLQLLTIISDLEWLQVATGYFVAICVGLQ